jgi:hypothetical protein
VHQSRPVDHAEQMGIEIPTNAAVGLHSLSVMTPCLRDSVGPMTGSVVSPRCKPMTSSIPLMVRVKAGYGVFRNALRR